MICRLCRLLSGGHVLMPQVKTVVNPLIRIFGKEVTDLWHGPAHYLCKAATPGKVLPSIHSRNAPPAVEI